MQKSLVSIAFGICTSNDENTIGRLLEQCIQIARKCLKGDYFFSVDEILIVSSGSVDNTNKIIREFQGNYTNITKITTVIEDVRKGKSDAVNQIFARYKSDYLVFVSADVEISFKSIQSLVLHITSNNQIGLVSGGPEPKLSEVESWRLKYILSAIWDIHNKTLKYTSELELNSHSSSELMILRRGIIESIPSNIINDDEYIAMKTRELGYKVDFEENASVLIDVPKTQMDYILQRRRIILGHKQLSKTIKVHQSHFRSLIMYNQMGALIILLNSITSLQKLIGLILAVIIELKIELSLKIENHKKPIKKRFNSVWPRINKEKVIRDS